jgi:hypothetical protein
LPDDCGQLVLEKERSPDPALLVSSYLLSAFERDCLPKFTAPVHRFLLQGDELHPNLTNQYRQDLQERWLSEQTVDERHGRFRQHFGKVVELQLANWLVEQDWTVSALEALGGDADIVAESPTRDSCWFEVKYIGWETDDFRRAVWVLTGGDDGGAMPALRGVPYEFLTASNYLLFRAYEAARRLQHCPVTGIAAVVIDALSWRWFARPLEERWIQWNAPAFLEAGDEWAQFLETKRKNYPELGTELTPVISALNHLWVFRRTDEDEYELEHEASPATGG